MCVLKFNSEVIAKSNPRQIIMDSSSFEILNQFYVYFSNIKPDIYLKQSLYSLWYVCSTVTIHLR
jgi:hypothetical protein